MNNKDKIFIIVILFVVGAGFLILVNSIRDNKQAEAVPAAVPTVTVTPSAARVVPQECLDALDEADNVIGIAGEGFSIVADIMRAVSVLDFEKSDRLNEKLGKVVSKLENSDYPELRDACREAAG